MEKTIESGQKQSLCDSITPFTMESMSRIQSFYDIIESTFIDNIPGDIVECGVWRGGMMMMAARLGSIPATQKDLVV